MTFTPIPAGTINWDVPVNAAFTSQDGRLTTAEGNIVAATSTANNAVPKDSQIINVKDHGVIGDGVADDSAAIAAIVASGGNIYFPSGTYLLNSATVVTLSTAGTRLFGAGTGNTNLVIGASFTGTRAIRVAAINCEIRDLQISGANATTTLNPVADAIYVDAVRRARVTNVLFANINGWCVQLASSGTANAFGCQLNQLYMNSCAGGIRTLGNTAQGYAMNPQISDIQFYLGGVTTGASANLDALRIEDSWDALVSDVILWMSAGTGSGLHIVGNCAASFIHNLDALGPTTGTSNVLVEANVNGSPQNVQIIGGVIQQGLVGLTVSGASNEVRVRGVRILNNQTHNVVISSTGFGIYLDESTFSLGGRGATGTNYDVDWTGSAEGWITDCRFSSDIVSIGTAGIQGVINITSAKVRVTNVNYSGSGTTPANKYPTNNPQFHMDSSGTNLEWRGNMDMRFTGTNRLQVASDSTSASAITFNVGGVAGFDNARILGDGTMQYGTGAAARDTTWGRQGVAQVGTTNSDILIGLAGKGLQVKSGANARIGTATLTAGTVTVNNTSVTANTMIVLAGNSGVVTANAGALFVSAVTAGTSFTVKSQNAADTSTFGYVLIEQF